MSSSTLIVLLVLGVCVQVVYPLYVIQGTFAAGSNCAGNAISYQVVADGACINSGSQGIKVTCNNTIVKSQTCNSGCTSGCTAATTVLACSNNGQASNLCSATKPANTATYVKMGQYSAAGCAASTETITQYYRDGVCKNNLDGTWSYLDCKKNTLNQTDCYNSACTASCEKGLAPLGGWACTSRSPYSGYYC